MRLHLVCSWAVHLQLRPTACLTLCCAGWGHLSCDGFAPAKSWRSIIWKLVCWVFLSCQRAPCALPGKLSWRFLPGLWSLSVLDQTSATHSSALTFKRFYTLCRLCLSVTSCLASAEWGISFGMERNNSNLQPPYLPCIKVRAFLTHALAPSAGCSVCAAWLKGFLEREAVQKCDGKHRRQGMVRYPKSARGNLLLIEPIFSTHLR